MRTSLVLVLFCLAIMNSAALAVRADWLYFSRGGQAELNATVRGPIVEVATPDGPKNFPTRAFQSIVPGGRFEDDWRDRESAARGDGSARALFAAAWWALEHGLTPKAAAMIRSAQAAAGSDQHAPLMRTGRMLDQLDAPVVDSEVDPLLTVLGGSRWSVLSSPHIALLYQGSLRDAQERIDVLERVVSAFYLSLAAQGIELPVPKRRLISVWFAEQDEYISWLRRSEAAPFADTQGYYHPTHAVVFAYDTRTSLEQSRPRQVIARRGKLPGISNDERTDLDRQTLLLDLQWRHIDLGIAAHETVHQLVAASGLAPRFDAFPNWLHEGLAAQFEVVRGGQWAGFGRANDFRLPDWRTIPTPPQLLPLLRDAGLTHGYQRDHYAEAWALVYFLRQTKPQEFVSFLEQLRTPQSVHHAHSPLAAFTASFGTDLETFGAEWRAFVRIQTTPLEDHSGKRPIAKSWD